MSTISKTASETINIGVAAYPQDVFASCTVEIAIGEAPTPDSFAHTTIDIAVSAETPDVFVKCLVEIQIRPLAIGLPPNIAAGRYRR